MGRKDGSPRLAEAPRPDEPEALELDSDGLVRRLEEQAAENGRLQARIESLEQLVRAERDARRRLASRLKRERKAAEAIHERAEQAQAAHAATLEELECVRRGAEQAEVHVQQAWTRLSEAERRLAHYERGLLPRLLRRPLERG